MSTTSTTSATKFDLDVRPPPVTVPTGAEAYLANKFNLSPAVAKVVRELAWPAPVTWIGGAH